MSNFNSVEDYMQNAENNRNSAVLKTLLEDEPGMRELPNITDNDIGNYLKVKSDKSLEWAEGGGSSGGGGALSVKGSWDEDTPTLFKLDKTWQEIFDAVSGGTPVWIYSQDSPEGYIVYYLTDVWVSNNNYCVMIARYEVEADGTLSGFGYEMKTHNANGYPDYNENA